MLKETITDDMKAAMRERDQVRLRTIRSIRAALQQKEIETRSSGAELTEQDELALLRKQAKQREDAISQYEDAGRDDLAQKERDELAVIKQYLPTPLTDDEIRGVIHEVVTATGATSQQAFGKVMGAVMGRLRGRADGARVQSLVRETLAEGGTS